MSERESGPRTRAKSGIVISSLRHLDQALEQFEVRKVISILSKSESGRLPAVLFGDREVLRLEFDDCQHSTENLVAPGKSDIEALIGFARGWAGEGGVLAVHCRAGVARSSAAALIAAAVIRPNHPDFLARVARAKSFFRQNEAMLRFADDLLGTSLVDLVRRLPYPDRLDQWSPAYIPIEIA